MNSSKSPSVNRFASNLQEYEKGALRKSPAKKAYKKKKGMT